MKRKQQGRALFYMRDSGGRHEMTPGQYVEWAQRRAVELNVTFHGLPVEIEAMMRDGRSVSGDIFLDYGVKGNVFSREALNALLERVACDLEVSHVLIPRRDRLARPDHPLDGMRLEQLLGGNGVTLVFMDRVCPPLPKGKRPDIGNLILAMVDYDKSGQDRRELARKIIFAQIALAKMGCSTGGRPCYGFRRWLVKDEGAVVRELAEGERVRMAGHHVVWLPTAEEELAVVRRILKMLETMPASRVAATLTSEGIPSPDSGRCRTDNGVRHQVSGVWHQPTIVNIARNSLLVAVSTYGLRSMGDQLRFTPDGPRELEECDYRRDEQPKVIRNAEAERITAPAKFAPVIDPEQHQKLLATLDRRAGTQRGKPRSSDPANNPLGCRVFDINCAWPMYRTPYNGSFRYKCGLYQQSHGQECAHNHVDGPTAAQFVLSCIRQRLLSPTLLPKLRSRLKQIAHQEQVDPQQRHQVDERNAVLAKVQRELERVTQNLARAESPEQYKAVAKVFEELQNREAALKAEIAKLESQTTPVNSAEEVDAAVSLSERLVELAKDQSDFAAAREVFDLANARLFLRFRPIRLKKRTLNKLETGVVTFGDAAPPIALYEGPTTKKVKDSRGEPQIESSAGVRPPPKRTDSGREDKSLRNVSRGDRI